VEVDGMSATKLLGDPKRVNDTMEFIKNTKRFKF